MEDRRKILHISMVSFALLISRMPAWAIAGICFGAIIFNLWLLPILTAKSLERKSAMQGKYDIGLLMYPTVLFLLSILFYEQQIFLAIGWSAMAFGDGFSSLVGRRWPMIKLPWHPHKSLGGLLGFLFFGFAGSFLILAALPETVLLGGRLSDWVLPIAIAIFLAAVAETIPGLVDDNLAAPVTAAVVSFFTFNIFQNMNIGVEGEFIYEFIFIAFISVLSLFTKKIDPLGAFVGGLLTLAMFMGAAWLGVALMGVFFVSGTLVSKWKRSRKIKLGLAQAEGGKRSVAHVLANGLVAGVCGLIAFLLPDYQGIMVAGMAGSLAAVSSDTFSSEVGNVLGKRYINVLTFRKAKRGMDGVVSWEGSLAGVVGSGLIALTYGAMMGWSWAVLLIGIAGLGGNLIDSVLGASVQRHGLMNNHTVNFFCALSGAIFSYWLLVF